MNQAQSVDRSRDPLSTAGRVYEVQGLHFQYGGSDSGTLREVLRNVSFFVEAGEMLGIVGPNGSGKTSLLKLLGKIVPVQQGSVALFGSSMSDLRQEAVAQSVAFVPQDTSQTFPFTVAETVLMARSVAAMVSGYAKFDSALQVAGVLFNRVGNEGHYRLLKDAVETETDVSVVGYLQPNPSVTIHDRHLGLVMGSSIRRHFAAGG